MGMMVLAAALVGLASLLGVWGVYGLVTAPGQLAQRVMGPTPMPHKPRRPLRERALLQPREGLSRLWWGEPGKGLALELERAGIPLRVGEYIALRVALGLIFCLVALIFSAPWWLLPLPALAGYWLPSLVVRRQKALRLVKMEAQLLEALPLMVNALRSGYSFLQAMDFVSKRVDHPLAWELARTVREIQIGADVDSALVAMARRTGSPDLDLVVTAILIQRQVGGNLAELLSTVEETMRERVRVRGEIRALTGQQRLSAMIIGFMPVFLTLVLLLLNPRYIGLLFTTTIGHALLAVAAVMEVMGLLVIRRILRIEV